MFNRYNIMSICVIKSRNTSTSVAEIRLSRTFNNNIVMGTQERITMHHGFIMFV